MTPQGGRKGGDALINPEKEDSSSTAPGNVAKKKKAGAVISRA